MKKYVVFGAAAVALILVFVFAATYYRGQQADKFAGMARQEGSVFVRPHSPTMGNDKAKVTIVEFMDPACETCAAFSSFVKQMIDANPGRIRLVLRYAPFHDGAEYFVKILEAAGEQDKYWETLEVMYTTQSYWASHHNPQPEKIWQFLPRAGLDIEQLKNDMTDPAIEQIIAQDLADARALNVQKTPGFFVNGRPLQSFGYQQLTRLVRTEFEKQYGN